jgi:hypothetical protein
MHGSYRLLAAVALLLPALLWGERVRALVVEELSVPNDASYQGNAELGPEEAVIIRLQEQNPYLAGLKIEMVLSNALKEHFDSFALAVYRSLTPSPNREVRFYEGQRVLFQYLPYLNRIYLLLPLGGGWLEEPPPVGTFQPAAALRREDFPLLLAVVPLGKGIPDSLAGSKFYFSVTPQLQRKGLVTLLLRFPPDMEQSAVSVFVDDNELPNPSGQQELPSGIHRLRVVSEAFKEINASFTVESGKAGTVEVQLEPLLSLLSVDAPPGAEVYVDGERVGGGGAPVPLQEGTHLVRVKVADRSVSKKITIEPGKDYHLSVVFDIIFNEN